MSFQVKGLKGKKCLEVTKELEEALGIVKSREKTAEFYQTETQAERLSAKRIRPSRTLRTRYTQ